MRKLIYTDSQGRFWVVTPVGISEQGVLDRLPADVVKPTWVEESAIPADRSFRDAWTHGGDRVNVDMDRAREIHAKRLLAEEVAAQRTEAALSALDTEAINDATTLDELKAVK